ncbi:MAG: hypothetical protein AAF519_14185, partial [Bacteroidota bacterium]
LFLPALCLIMTSCVYSLFPIYTEETVRYIPEIMGTWETSDGYAIFEPTMKKESTTAKSDELNENKKNSGSLGFGDLGNDLETPFQSYRLTMVDKRDSTEKFTFLTHLVEIGDEMFVDLYAWPVESEEKRAANLFPVHSFMKFKFENDTITFTNFNLSKLKDLFKSNLIRIRHEMVEEEVIITAQPKEIQKFLETYSKDPSVLETPNVYSRVI